jgi:hypothetical protein
LIKKKYNQIL